MRHLFGRHLFGLGGLCLWISLISNASFGAYLAEEFVNPSTQIKETSDFIRDASSSNLISVGETHSRGVERQVFYNIYQKLFHDLNKRPKCLVEDFNTLFQPQDVVTPIFKTGCESIQSLGGNTPLTTGFAEGLKNSMGSGSHVITHTGYRHILPFGLLFPYDDFPTAVDTQPRNTISTQIPVKLASKTKMTALVAMNLEDIYLAVITGEMSKLAGSSQPVIAQGLKAIGKKIIFLFSQPNLNRLPNPTQNLFMLPSLQSSFPSRKVYVSLIDRQPVNFDILEKFLATPQMTTFLQESRAGERFFGVMSHVSMGFCQINLEAGGLLFFNSHEYLGVQPDGQLLRGSSRCVATGTIE